MKMIVQDRSFVVHKLNSTELLNDMLQVQSNFFTWCVVEKKVNMNLFAKIFPW